MMFMASGFNLISIWISLELMALSSYILAGYFKRELKSNEAALKYFVLGALSSGVMLYGMSLLYGGTGSIQLEGIASAIAAAESHDSQGVFDAGAEVYAVCSACHAAYALQTLRPNDERSDPVDVQTPGDDESGSK